MMFLRILVPMLILAQAVASPTWARTWVVDQSGGGDFTRVIPALAAVVDGDTVAVRPGAYDESAGETAEIVIVGRGFTLRGLGDRPDDVRLRFGVSVSECSLVRVENVTFHDEYSTVIANLTPLLVSRCVFSNNTADSYAGSGGAIRCPNGLEVTVEGCAFMGNRAGEVGGAISHDGSMLRLRNCTFSGNEATREGGAVSAPSGLDVENCLFVDNASQHGAALRTRGFHPRVAFSTFYRNRLTDPDGAVIELDWDSQSNLEHCIVGGTVNGYGIGCYGAAQTFCYCFWQNDRGNDAGGCASMTADGNFEADPLFCNPDLGDFRLSGASPCLPGEHGGYLCGLIGAYEAGCNITPIETMRWGRIKARYSPSSR